MARVPSAIVQILALLGTLSWVSNAWVITAPPPTSRLMGRHHFRAAANNLPSLHSPSPTSASFSFTAYSTLSSRKTYSSSSSRLMAAPDGGGAENKADKSNLPFWLDIGTKGGAVFWSLVLFIIPILGYNFVTGVLGYDEIEAGKWIGVGFTAVAMSAWSSTYLFRVATKDMTYAKQLKDYENAVIAKRLEELDDDEIQALVEEIERDDF